MYICSFRKDFFAKFEGADKKCPSIGKLGGIIRHDTAVLHIEKFEMCRIPFPLPPPPPPHRPHSAL